MPSSREQRLVRVHARAVHAVDRLRHERRVQAVLLRHVLDDEAERADVVGGRPARRRGGSRSRAGRRRPRDAPPRPRSPSTRAPARSAAARPRRDRPARGRSSRPRRASRWSARRRASGRGRTPLRARSSSRSRRSAAWAMARFSACRGQPANGVPSGLWMSQISRPIRSPVFCVHGRMRKVERSGRRNMSDSSIRTNPSIDEPSNMISPSSAAANWRSGISTFLMTPRMSVNWSRMNFTFMRSASSRIFAFFRRRRRRWRGISGRPCGPGSLTVVGTGRLGRSGV